MTESSKNMNDELLSAYFDGELSAEQQQYIHQLLRDEEDVRQSLDEMQLLRDTLQSLPRQQLDDDFARRVLDMAERRMLGESSGDQHTEAPRPKSSLILGRRYFWSATALAAGLLIMFFGPDNPKERSVVLHTETEAPLAELRSRNHVEAPVPAVEEVIMGKGGQPLSWDEQAAGEERLGQSIQGGNSSLVDDNLEKISEARGLTVTELSPNHFAAADAPDEALGRAHGDGEAENAHQWLVKVAAEAVDSDLVVQLELRERTSNGDAFDQVLVNNRIAIAPENLELVKQVTQEVPQAVIVEPNFSIDTLPSDEEKQNTDSESKYQLVYVEASPEQIVEATRELEENSHDFSQVRIESRRGKLGQPAIDLAATRELVRRRSAAPESSVFPRPTPTKRNNVAVPLLVRQTRSYAQRVELHRENEPDRNKHQKAKLELRNHWLAKQSISDGNAETLNETESDAFGADRGLLEAGEGNLRVLFVLHTPTASKLENDVNRGTSIPALQPSQSKSELPTAPER